MLVFLKSSLLEIFKHAKKLFSENSENLTLPRNTHWALKVLSWLKILKTSRDRPKSAPYPRLKISKKTSKCQVFSFTVLENRKFLEKKFEKITYSKKWTEARQKGDTPEIVNIFVAVGGGPSEKKQIFEKNLIMPKN